MRSHRILPLALSLVLALAVVAVAGAATSATAANHNAAASAPSGQKTLIATGQAVEALSGLRPSELILNTKDGQETFVVNSDSKVSETIGAGDTVTVWYVKRHYKRYAATIEKGDHAGKS